MRVLIFLLFVVLVRFGYGFVAKTCEGTEGEHSCACAGTEEGISCPEGNYCPELDPTIWATVLAEDNCFTNGDGIMQCPCTPGLTPYMTHNPS